MPTCVEQVEVFGPVRRLYPAWDGGARSVREFAGDCYFGFATNPSTVGAVVGLNTVDVGYHFREIQHGFRFARGDYYIMEYGVSVAGPFPFSADDRFYIFRVGTDVLYIHKNDTDFSTPVVDGRYPGTYLPASITYISTNPSTGTVFLDSSLYQFNDYVFNEEGGEVYFPAFTFVSQEGREAIGLGQLPFSASGVASADAGAIGAGQLPFSLTAETYFLQGGTIQLPFIAEGFASDTSQVEQRTVGYGELGFTGGLGDGRAGYDGIAGTTGGAQGYLNLVFASTGNVVKQNPVSGYGYLGFTADGLSDDTGAQETVGRGELPFFGIGISLGFYGNYFNILLPTFGVVAQRFEEELTNALSASISVVTVEAVAITDSFNIAQVVEAYYALEFRETVSVASLVQQFTQQAVELISAAGVTDAIQLAIVLSLSEQIQAASQFTVTEAAQLVEQITASGAVQTSYQATALVFAAVAVADAQVAAFAQTVSDNVQLTDDAQFALKVLALINEMVNVSDDVQHLLSIVMEVSDGVSVADSQELTAQYFAEVASHARLYALLKTPAELAQGWVMNTEGSLPISEYDNYVFNSLAYGVEQMIGANDQGIYVLEGDNDAGTDITAELTSMMLDFATSRQKRVRSAYVGYTSTGELVLKVRAVESGQLVEHWYKGRKTTAQTPPGENLVHIGQGLKSRYWQFELTNIDGADFEIDQVELYPIMLGRRV